MFFAPVIGVMKQAENLNDVADKATSRGNLDVPTRSGGNASGTWGISISGNAATVTTVSTSQVLGAMAGLSAGAVGSFGFLRSTGVTSSFGSTVSGSILTPASCDEASGSTQSGTWMCLGRALNSGTDAQMTTLWVRIA